MLIIENFDDIAHKHGYDSMHEAKRALELAGLDEELTKALVDHFDKHITREDTTQARKAIDIAMANIHKGQPQLATQLTEKLDSHRRTRR